MPNLAATTREPDSTVAAADPDFPGLSFAYRFRDGLAEPLTARDIPGALAEPGGWIWIHLSLTDTFARDWIAQTAPLPERARQILLSDDDHQLLEPIDGGVAGVFADLLREFAGESRELGRLHFALTDTLVVSGRLIGAETARTRIALIFICPVIYPDLLIRSRCERTFPR